MRTFAAVTAVCATALLGRRTYRDRGHDAEAPARQDTAARRARRVVQARRARRGDGAHADRADRVVVRATRARSLRATFRFPSSRAARRSRFVRRVFSGAGRWSRCRARPASRRRSLKLGERDGRGLPRPSRARWCDRLLRGGVTCTCMKRTGRHALDRDRGARSSAPPRRTTRLVAAVRRTSRRDRRAEPPVALGVVERRHGLLRRDRRRLTLMLCTVIASVSAS